MGKSWEIHGKLTISTGSSVDIPVAEVKKEVWSTVVSGRDPLTSF